MINSERYIIEEHLICCVYDNKESIKYIESLERNEWFLSILLEILNKSFSNDAKTKATFIIKEFPADLLETYKNEIFKILINDREDDCLFLSIALARINSKEAKEFIYKLYDEDNYANWIIKEAIEIYESFS